LAQRVSNAAPETELSTIIRFPEEPLVYSVLVTIAIVPHIVVIV